MARRYTVREVRDKLHACGFARARVTYAYMLLLPPALLLRAVARLRPGRQDQSDFGPVPRVLDVLARAACSCEAVLLRAVNLPCGLSVMAVAVK